MFLVAIGVASACSPNTGSAPPRGGGLPEAGAGPASGGARATGGSISTLGGSPSVGSGGASPLGTGGTSSAGGSGGLTASGGTGGTNSGGTATGGTTSGTGGGATGGTNTASGGSPSVSCPAQGTGGLASLSTGLIGYWKFDEADTSGATTADASGMNFSGTYSATKPALTTAVPPLLTGKSMKAIVFNGTNEVKLPAGSFGNWSAATSYSISAWVQVTALDGDWMGIIANEAAGATTYCGLYIGGAQNSTQNAFRYQGNETGFGDLVPTPGVWYHLALVQDVSGNAQRLYVNGQPAGTGELKDCATTGVFHFGSVDGADTPTFFNGSLDDVRFYNRALMPTEVTALACGAQ
ncbi:MAG: LamG domain-containing protein [Polyangiaceae bacterium]|nr:LamG domain-containing protein [Polyangiaceae bacterium]